MTYIVQSDVETYLNTSLTANGIALFNLMEPLMEDLINSYCNRSWSIAASQTQIWDALQETTAPIANDTFIVDYPPITNVQSVTVGGVEWDLNFVYIYDTFVKLWVRPQTIVLPNPLGFRSVEITYTSGAAGNLPGAVKLAMIEWMALKIETAQDAGKQVISTQAGSVKVQYTDDSNGTGIPSFVKMALSKYRLSPVEHW